MNMARPGSRDGDASLSFEVLPRIGSRSTPESRVRRNVNRLTGAELVGPERCCLDKIVGPTRVRVDVDTL
jgi:hypothetical protein